MSRVIALSGSHSTGKTTLLKKIKEHYGDKLIYIEEIARTLLKNKIYDDKYLLQKDIFETTIEKIKEVEKQDKIAIIDRSFVDIQAYTLAYQREIGITNYMNMVRLAESCISEHMKKIEAVIYIPIVKEIQLEEDGIRSSGLDFRSRIEELIKNGFEQTFLDTNVNTIKEINLEKRLQEATKIIERYRI